MGKLWRKQADIILDMDAAFMLAFNDTWSCVKNLEKGTNLRLIGYFAPRNKMKRHRPIWLELKTVVCHPIAYQCPSYSSTVFVVNILGITHQAVFILTGNKHIVEKFLKEIMFMKKVVLQSFKTNLECLSFYQSLTDTLFCLQ